MELLHTNGYNIYSFKLWRLKTMSIEALFTYDYGKEKMNLVNEYTSAL